MSSRRTSPLPSSQPKFNRSLPSSSTQKQSTRRNPNIPVVVSIDEEEAPVVGGFTRSPPPPRPKPSRKLDLTRLSDIQHDSKTVQPGSAFQRSIDAVVYNGDQSAILSLPAADARTALNDIWKLLELPLLPEATTGYQSSDARNKLRRVALKGSLKYDILPTALFLRGVKCTESDSRGAGGFADVFYGTLGDTPVALKRLRVYKMSLESQKTKMKQAFYRESLLWKHLDHKHILPFLGVSEDVFQHTISMVLPWMAHGSIRQYIDVLTEQGRLLEKDFERSIDKWLYQIVLGLKFLHEEGIVHGDLHAGNILIDAEGGVRLTDFGMALISEATAYNYASIHGGGASRWQAPELIDPDEFGLTTTRPTPASDVYSFGCTCVELYSGQIPFAGLNERQVALRVLKGERPPRPSLPDGTPMSDAIWALTTSCWHHQAPSRPLSAHVAQTLGVIVSPPLAAPSIPDLTPVDEMVKPFDLETGPQTQEQREQYFTVAVAKGVQLCQYGPVYYSHAASAFFQGFIAYDPSPKELLLMYNQMLLPPVLQLVMKMLPPGRLANAFFGWT